MFNKGDTVKRVSGGDYNGVVVGEEYTINAVSDHGIRLNGLRDTWYDEEHFELVRFDMTSKWFIRVGDSSHGAAVQKWLFDQGFKFNTHGATTLRPNLQNVLITNGDGGGFIYTLSLDDAMLKIERGAKEIVVHTALVVSNVIYPKNETTQEKKIRELEETIIKAQEQIKQLRKGI